MIVQSTLRVPRTASQNAALRSATRERLLAAAMRRFAADGFDATSVRAIATDAGVATGLLYAHFDSKDTLLFALFARSMQQVHGTFGDAMRAAPQPSIAVLIRAAVQAVRADVDFWRLSYAVRMQPAVVATLGATLDGWRDAIIGSLTELLRRNGSPQPALDALALFAQIDGLCQHFAIQPTTYPVDDAADRVIARWTMARPEAW